MVKCVLFISPVGPLGACGIIDGKGYNLGYVQSRPQAAEDGSISILYQNGDRCGSTSRYSTRVILQCDENPVSIRGLLWRTTSVLSGVSIATSGQNVVIFFYYELRQNLRKFLILFKKMNLDDSDVHVNFCRHLTFPKQVKKLCFTWMSTAYGQD